MSVLNLSLFSFRVFALVGLFLLCWAGLPRQVSAQTLTWDPTGLLVVCPGTTQQVSVIAVGSFAAGNRFDVQLSDGTGSFAAPQVVGTLARSGNLNERLTIDVFFPDVDYNGTTYRLRVASSDPQVLSGIRVVAIIRANLTPSPQQCDSINGKIIVETNAGGSTGFIKFGNRPEEGMPSTSKTYDKLAAGDYTVIFRTASGCTLTKTTTVEVAYTIVMPRAPAIVNTRCGESEGKITLTASFSNAIVVRVEATDGSYVYDFQAPLRTRNVTVDSDVFQEFTFPDDFPGAPAGLPAGTYTVTLRDGANCILRRTVTIINDPNNASVDEVTLISQPNCANSTNGSILITARGTGTLELFLNGVNITTGAESLVHVADGLLAGVYRIRVEDEAGCSDFLDFTLEPLQPDFRIFIETTPPGCGLNNGRITAWAEPETLTYRYRLDGNTGQDNGIFAGLSSETTYLITVTDVNSGCQRDTSIRFPAGGTLIFDEPVETRPPSCENPTGDYALTTFGAAEPIILFVNAIESTDSCVNIACFLRNLAAGTYQLRVVDANGCEATQELVVADFSTLQLIGLSILNVSCNGSSDGNVSGAANGQGVITATLDGPLGLITQARPSPFSFNFQQLPAGPYSLEIKAEDGCEIDSIFTITEPDPIAFTVKVLQPSCVGNGFNGSIEVLFASGPDDLLYSLAGPRNGQASTVFANLGFGSYNVTAYRASNLGCFASITVVLGNPLVNLQNLIDSYTLSVISTCPGESDGIVFFDIPADTIAKYGLEFSNDAGRSWQSDPSFQDLPASPQIIFVRDVNGCQLEFDAIIGIFPAVDFTVIVSPPPCATPQAGGALEFSSLDPTLKYATATSNTAPADGSYQIVSRISGLAVGTDYYVFAQGANGCIFPHPDNPFRIPAAGNVDLVSVVAVAPSCAAVNDGSVSVRATGGTAPFKFSSDNVSFSADQTDPNFTFSNLRPGSFIFYVEDAAGCVAQVEATVPQAIALDLRIDPDVLATRGTRCGTTDNGYLTAQWVSGKTPVQFSIDNNNWQDNGRFNNLTAGTYTIYMRVVGVPACVESISYTLAAGTDLDWSIQEVLRRPCPAGALVTNNGQLNFAVTGGNPTDAPVFTLVPRSTGIPLPDNTSGFFNNLPADTYDIFVNDPVDLCFLESSIELIASPAVVFNRAVPTPALCPDGREGSLRVEATGGSPDLLYSIDGTSYSAAPLFSGLADGGGPFVIRIRDNSNADPQRNNCDFRFNAPALVRAAAAPNLLLQSSLNPTCNETNGEIRANASGGVGAVTYELFLDNTAVETNATGLFSRLGGGNYRVVAYDARPCTTELRNIVLSEPASFTIGVINISNTTCGRDNGRIDGVNLSNPNEDYEYALSANGPWIDLANPLFNNLAAGPYTLYVRQKNPPRCTQSKAITLNATNRHGITFTEPITKSACQGENNGRITLQASTTLGSLDITLQPGGRSFTSPPAVAPFVFDNLAAGIYALNLIDGANCPPVQIQVELIELPKPTLVLEPTDPVCPSTSTANPAGLLLGSITARAANGSTPYANYWITGRTAQAEPLFADLATGVYSGTVSDANGCTATASTTIEEAPAMSVDNLEGFLAPCESAKGRIVATGRGFGNLVYQVLNRTAGTVYRAQNDGTFDNVDPETYGFRLLDERPGGTCTLTVAETVTVGAGNVLTMNLSVQQPSCGQDNGEIDFATLSGFTNPVILLNGVETPVMNNLSSGTYTVRVEEFGKPECFRVETVELKAAGEIMATLLLETQRPCKGLADGLLRFTATGGTNLRFLLEQMDGQTVLDIWNNSDGRFADLPDGTYRLTVTNSEGCSRILDNQTLTEYEALTLDPTYTGPTCTNPNDVELTVTAIGGAGAYEYAYNGGPFVALTTKQALTAAEAYTLSVRDTAGCVLGPLDFAAPEGAEGLLVSIDGKQNPSCNGATDGWLQLTAPAGGTAPYRYRIDGGNILPLPADLRIIGLKGDTDFVLQILDSANPPCSFTFPVLDSRLVNPAAVVITVSDENKPTCSDATDGSFAITVKGGTAPYTVDVFRNGNSYDQVPDLAENAPEVFSDLLVGTYRVEAVDASRCTTETTVDLTVPTVVIGDTVLVCAVNLASGASATYDLNGLGTPAGGTWAGSGLNIQNGILTYSAAEFNQSFDLTYTVDACSASTQLYVTALEVDEEIEACTNDLLTLKATPNAGNWQDADGTLTSGLLLGDQLNLEGVVAGTYRLRFYSDGRCQALRTLTVHPLPEPAFVIETPVNDRLINEPILFRADEARTGFTHSWTFDPQAPAASGAEARVTFETEGDYTVLHEITSDKGCKADDSQEFEVLPLPQLQLPPVFTPNGDGQNDFFPLIGSRDGLNPDELLSFRVFDRTGQRVYEWKRGEPGWDGLINGKEATESTYFWQAEFRPLNVPRNIVRTGNVTLLR